MKVYRFFLKKSRREKLDMDVNLFMTTKYRHIDDDTCLVHYAWTTDKEIRDEFQQYRIDDFIYDKTYIPDDMFHEFKIEFKESELSYRDIPHINRKTGKEETVKVLSTFAEFTVINEFSEEIFGTWVEESCMSESGYIKDEFRDALDLLLYTMYHGIYWGDDRDSEFVSYQHSYGLTPYGHNYDPVIDSIDLFYMFVRLFSGFFKQGDHV